MEHMDGWMAGRLERWMDEWKDREMDEQIKLEMRHPQLSCSGKIVKT